MLLLPRLVNASLGTSPYERYIVSHVNVEINQCKHFRKVFYLNVEIHIPINVVCPFHAVRIHVVRIPGSRSSMASLSPRKSHPSKMNGSSLIRSSPLRLSGARAQLLSRVAYWPVPGSLTSLECAARM